MNANSLIRKGVYISYPCPDVSLKVYKKALTYNIVDCGRIRACQEVGEEIHHHNSILFGLEGERKNISDIDKCLDKTSNAGYSSSRWWQAAATNRQGSKIGPYYTEAQSVTLNDIFFR